MKRIWGYWSQAMGCLGLVVAAIALLVIGSCQWRDMRTKDSIRASLPAQYRDGEFAYFKQCGHGFTYIFKLSPAAAQRLRANAARESAGAQSPPLWGSDTNLEVWPDTPEGLRCWDKDRPYREKPERLGDHLHFPSSYRKETDRIFYQYFVPSLGVIAGGNEPG